MKTSTCLFVFIIFSVSGRDSIAAPSEEALSTTEQTIIEPLRKIYKEIEKEQPDVKKDLDKKIAELKQNAELKQKQDVEMGNMVMDAAVVAYKEIAKDGSKSETFKSELEIRVDQVKDARVERARFVETQAGFKQNYKTIKDFADSTEGKVSYNLRRFLYVIAIIAGLITFFSCKNYGIHAMVLASAIWTIIASVAAIADCLVMECCVKRANKVKPAPSASKPAPSSASKGGFKSSSNAPSSSASKSGSNSASKPASKHGSHPSSKSGSSK